MSIENCHSANTEGFCEVPCWSGITRWCLLSCLGMVLSIYPVFSISGSSQHQQDYFPGCPCMWKKKKSGISWGWQTGATAAVKTSVLVSVHHSNCLRTRRQPVEIKQLSSVKTALCACRWTAPLLLLGLLQSWATGPCSLSSCLTRPCDRKESWERVTFKGSCAEVICVIKYPDVISNTLFPRIPKGLQVEYLDIRKT